MLTGDLKLVFLLALSLWNFALISGCLSKSKQKQAPGLEFRPTPKDGSTLIWYKGTNPENFRKWTDQLDEFLKAYKNPGLTPGRGQNIYNCDYGNEPPAGMVCNIDVNIRGDFGPCSEENFYSYHRSAPCVFLALDKIPDWVPEYYNDSAILPPIMPSDLKNHIENLGRSKPIELSSIWVSCEGENPADLENIGPISYYPRRGFPGYYFPYQNQEGYLSSLVAIHFERPVRGVVINVECKAWARNLKQDRDEKIGTVHFELLID